MTITDVDWFIFFTPIVLPRSRNQWAFAEDFQGFGALGRRRAHRISHHLHEHCKPHPPQFFFSFLLSDAAVVAVVVVVVVVVRGYGEWGETRASTILDLCRRRPAAAAVRARHESLNRSALSPFHPGAQPSTARRGVLSISPQNLGQLASRCMPIAWMSLPRAQLYPASNGI
jgi:hypothetical protein